ncbi:hypothetical protein HY500_01675 [Candidatus Woesearchaeota archaeon]|nr:hypothetical protein [Candidatus Woesearchaeota archaeon]
MANQVVIYRKIEVLDDSQLQAYQESLQSLDEEVAQRLRGLEGDNGYLSFSTPFRLVHLLNSGLLPAGTRLAERLDLEIAIAEDPKFVEGKWVEFGIALKTAGDSYAPNDIPARVLAEELKSRGISLGSGKLIPYNVLRNVGSQDSDYRMVLNLSDQFKNSSVRDLSDFRWDYTRKEGMARAFLYRGRGWGCDNWDLGNSYSSGRVVVVGGEATEKN